MNKDYNIIAIDTSTAVMAGAAYSQNTLLAALQTEAERNHSIHIMTNIEQLVNTSNWSVQDVSHYVVGIGPGSYTGVRIAVTAAKTLAWATQNKIVAVSSLEGLAYSAIVDDIKNNQQLEQTIAIVPIMDARRGQVYTALFNQAANEQENWNRVHHDHITLMEAWVDRIAEQAKQGAYDAIWIVGDVQLHQEAIARLSDSMKIPVIALPTKMNGLALAKLGESYIAANQHIYAGDHIHQLAPNYAQLTEAEVKQNAKDKEERHG